jgi:hypothetical protein
MTTPAPAYQEIAALADFLSLGLPAEALRRARTIQAPVTTTGAGAGVVTPSGALDVAAVFRTSLDVRVEIVLGGAVGVATWRWSADAGSTWSSTVTTSTTPARLVIPSTPTDTGLVVAFGGTLVTSAVYTWTATSCVAAALRAANEEAYRYLSRTRTPPFDPVSTDVVRDACALAAADVMAVVGYNPDGSDALLERRAEAARKRFREARDGEVNPRTGDGGAQVRAPRVWSPSSRR